MEFMKQYMVLVVIGICLCVGYMVKNFIPTKKVNQYIPLIVCVLGVFVNVWANGWTISPSILLGGLASGWASTGLHSAFKNFLDGKK